MTTGSSALLACLLLGSWAHAARPAAASLLEVPGYGPGVVGQVTRGPLTPLCRPTAPCTGPFAGASVQILDGDAVVGTAVTNAVGHFIVSVPPGDYVVHVLTIDFPRCPEATVHVGKKKFSLTALDCDTGIR